MGVIDYTEEEMKLNLDIRYPKNGDADLVYRQMKSALTAYDMDIFGASDHRDAVCAERFRAGTKADGSVPGGTGEDTEPKAIGGGTYAKMFQTWLLSDRCFREIRTWHTADEQMS